MPQLIKAPFVLPASGENAERIEEYIGRLASETSALSLARIVCPPDWAEPAQRPEFDEATLVLKGVLNLESEGELLQVSAGEAVLVKAGETIRYTTPASQGAEYLAFCAPAFAMPLAHREGMEATPRSEPLPALTIVGYVRAPITEPVDEGWGEVESVIELAPAYHGATRGLEEFSHALIVTYLHCAHYEAERHLLRRPRGRADMPELGIFAQRAKDRPNPIGITAVRIVSVNAESLVVRGLDAIDGTPVLDIKPYNPAFDRVDNARIPEWMERLMHGYF